MKLWSKAMIWFALSLFVLYLVDVFTVSPTVTSGNGNLGLLFVFPAPIVCFFFIKHLRKVLQSLDLQPKTWLWIRVGSLLFFAIGCLLEYQYVLHMIHSLGGTPKEEASRIYRYPWLNQYTNTMFVNVYTFLCISTLAICFTKKK
ncbi:hypothetical protein MUG87_17950 [Ectobacillus sp. JY-23]|uniref:hypothetical protein n=1 Tax=Ectobacillus sp. JY-23 TaxID=2933872 RepID=UPI001FF4363F|nr:hypothetical protein [Ectobacillus sp. JY-23]UOY92291.1 hypothetical protein MUG87_17950 [Ectobacillus sp. JY-23]